MNRIRGYALCLAGIGVIALALLGPAPHPVSSQTAGPAPSPTVAAPLPPEGGCPLALTAGQCHIGPCDRSAIQPPPHLPGARYARTPQGFPIRLQRLPGAATVDGLAVDAGWAAWSVPEILGARHTIRPRLYLARVAGFRPIVVAAPSCADTILGPFLSQRWLVWAEWYQTAYDLHDSFTIRAMDLAGGQRLSWTFPYTSTELLPGVGLSGDTLVWTRQQWEGEGTQRTLVYGIYARTLPAGPAHAIEVVREHTGPNIPATYVDGYVDPQVTGNFVVWERSRRQNGVPRTDILAVSLPRGHVQVLARGNAEAPVTNRWKVAWLQGNGNAFDLVLLDRNTGVRKVLARNALIWAAPRFSATTLSWQTRGRRDIFSRYLRARDLLTGRQYTFVHWFGARATPSILRVVGPGMADGNHVVWEEIVRWRGRPPVAYLANAGIPARHGGR